MMLFFPATVENGYQLGGTGLAMNEWRGEKGIQYRADLSDGQLFTTKDLPFAVKIALEEASGWMGAETPTQGLEAELAIGYTVCTKKGEMGEALSRVDSPERWFMLVQDTNGDGYDRVLLSKSRKVNEAFSVLSLGEWSGIVITELETKNGLGRGAFRCKLLDLSKDGTQVSLLVTPICNLDGYSHPRSLHAEIAKVNPLALPSHVFFDGFGWGWFDEKTFIELVDMEHQWFADAATYLMKNKEWQLLMMHMHAPDWLYHYAVPPGKMDPLSEEYEGLETAKFYEDIEVSAYQNIDKAVGRIVEAATEDAIVVIVSDHGAKPATFRFSPIVPLAEARLLSLKKTAKGRIVDLSKSRAIPVHGPWIYVNLEDRYSHGIVKTEDYKEVQEAVIKALYEHVDPRVDKKPVALALKKEDARLLGLYGDRIGDVVYAISEHYGGTHGQLPTARYGIGSLRGLLIMTGPGLKRGCVVKSTVRATDIVPTVCHLTGLPIPRDCEGRILCQALRQRSSEAVEPGRSSKPAKRLEVSKERLEETFQVES